VSILSLALAGNRKKPRGKSVAGQSGRIYERNAVVETRSVSVTSRRLRCRLATIGCYRPPCSSQRADYRALILTKDYACLLPPLHIVPLRFTTSLFFSPSSCPHRRVRSAFRFIDLLALSRFSSRHALTPPVSHPLLYKYYTFLTPSLLQKSLSLPCPPPQPLLSLSNSSHNGLISPRGCLFK
jgi:hypothetical protein